MTLFFIKKGENTMGLDSYIFKVKAPNNEQMRQVKYCTWDDIKEKLDLTAIAVDDFMNLPDTLKDRVYYHFGDNKTEQAAKAYRDKIVAEAEE